MGPIFETLKGEYEGKPAAKFLMIDFTDKSTFQATASQAAELGINDVYSYNKTTAVIILVNADTLSAIGKLNLNNSVDEMRALIDKAMN